jgi:hypothetical protein
VNSCRIMILRFRDDDTCAWQACEQKRPVLDLPGGLGGGIARESCKAAGSGKYQGHAGDACLKLVRGCTTVYHAKIPTTTDESLRVYCFFGVFWWVGGGGAAGVLCETLKQSQAVQCHTLVHAYI